MAGHLTLQEREVLCRMKKAGKSRGEIAAALGRHRCTIYRELTRNTGGRGYARSKPKAWLRSAAWTVAGSRR